MPRTRQGSWALASVLACAFIPPSCSSDPFPVPCYVPGMHRRGPALQDAHSQRGRQTCSKYVHKSQLLCHMLWGHLANCLLKLNKKALTPETFFVL